MGAMTSSDAPESVATIVERVMRARFGLTPQAPLRTPPAKPAAESHDAVAQAVRRYFRRGDNAQH